MVSVRLWVSEVVFGSFFVGSGCLNVKKDNEMEPFLGEAVGASEGGLGGRSWGLFKVPRHRGFEATRVSRTGGGFSVPHGLSDRLASMICFHYLYFHFRVLSLPPIGIY